MRLRPVLSVAILAALVCAVPGQAVGARPQIVDPAGDERGMQAGTDIVSTTFDTAGHKVGKKYVPDSLVVTMTLAAPVMKQQGLRYAVTANAEGCDIIWSYTPGVPLDGTGVQFVGCGDPSTTPGSGPGRIINVTPKTAGKTIVWSLKFKAIPKEIRPGTLVTKLHAGVDVVDPAFGLFGPYLVGDAAGVDTATSDADWEIH